MYKSKIEWTQKTWNPSAGCTKISSGCKNCYAETMAIRLQAMGVEGYENGFKFNTVPSRLNDPIKRKKPTVYFVNSMSDIFHENMPEEYLNRIFKIIELTPQHTYQILTKRADRMFRYLSQRNIPKNIWLGVTVENRIEGLPRIDKLRKLQASVLFLSIEPLLEDLGEMNLKNIDWVIVGGESGNKARPMKEEWVLNILSQCTFFGIPFFFKQWGGVKKKQAGRRLLNQTWDAMPEKTPKEK